MLKMSFEKVRFWNSKVQTHYQKVKPRCHLLKLFGPKLRFENLAIRVLRKTKSEIWSF